MENLYKWSSTGKLDSVQMMDLNNNDQQDKIWDEIHNLETPPSFQWEKSVARSEMLAKINIDPNNVVFDPSFHSSGKARGGGGGFPAFAVGLAASTGGLLEPTRVDGLEQKVITYARHS